MMDITDRKSAEEELERKANQQDRLLQTARHLTESLDVKEVLTNIAKGAKEIIHAQGCSLYLLETNGITLTPVVAIDPSYEEEILATPLKISESFTGKAILARRALIFNDPQSDGSGKQIPGTPVEVEEKIIVAPLIVDEKVLGAMCLDRMRVPFTQEDLGLAETFATYASTALKNAQAHNNLHQEVQQRRRMERKLKQTMVELKRSNDELQQFAYVASHDLQEPLRMVASYVQLLSKRYRGKLDKDADEFINFAVDGATRMQGLINDLLAYSRVGTRGRPFERIDLKEVYDRAVANLQAAIVETRAHVDHGPLPTLMIDKVQFTQLFQNLIGNAIKFHNQEPPQVHVAAEQRNGEWILSVQDNGIGIDQEYAERIFMIFQRLHNRSEYKGTGIGLAICKKIVERHGGRIWVESRPGEGATFYFTVPLEGEQKS
jgi:light-regulated signal transduction histidine kinase (bacteriophytochrome)